MNLYISGSNRKKNCYKVLEDIKNKEDKLISLKDKDIKYCFGCNKKNKSTNKFKHMI